MLRSFQVMHDLEKSPRRRNLQSDLLRAHGPVRLFHVFVDTLSLERSMILYHVVVHETARVNLESGFAFSRLSVV